MWAGRAQISTLLASSAVIKPSLTRWLRAQLWCAHLPAYGPTLSRQMRSEVGLILPPQTWQGEDMRAVMAIAMWVQSRPRGRT